MPRRRPNARTLALVMLTAASFPAGRLAAQSTRHIDAHADRVVLSPTAETHPEGTLFLTSYEIIGWQAGYAPSDRLHVSVAGVSDFNTAGFVELNAKANVLRSPALRVAVTSSVDYLAGEDIDVVFGRIGSTAQVCFEPRCRSSFNLSVMLAIHDAPDVVLPLGTAAGLVARVADEADLLLEIAGIFNASQELPLIDLPIFVLNYGARIRGNEHWALDVALMREMASREGFVQSSRAVFDLLGLPLLAFTYRFEP